MRGPSKEVRNDNDLTETREKGLLAGLRRGYGTVKGRVRGASSPRCSSSVSSRAPLTAQNSQSRSLPIFEVDSAWPQVPEKWKLGDPSSFAIDAQDNVWLLHRPRTLPPEQASLAAPPVMVFDPSGRFVRAWGGAGNGYEWPEREHGIHVDAKGFVWLGGNDCRPTAFAASNRSLTISC